MVYQFVDYAVSDIFQNPEIVAVAIGALAFLFTFVVVHKSLKFQKGISIVIAFAIGFTAGWYLYTNDFVWEFTAAGVAVGIAVLAVLFVIVRAFFRFGKHRFRRG
jgi:membrane protein YdbS with pleckstrin-like domain